jgi:hypothetical protein
VVGFPVVEGGSVRGILAASVPSTPCGGTDATAGASDLAPEIADAASLDDLSAEGYATTRVSIEGADHTI